MVASQIVRTVLARAPALSGTIRPAKFIDRLGGQFGLSQHPGTEPAVATQQSVGARPETQRMDKARWGQGRPIAAALDQCARDTKVFDMVKEIEASISRANRPNSVGSSILVTTKVIRRFEPLLNAKTR